MHLRLIDIENFRGIKKLSLKLDVITAVFGEGSFGKSSLIEALKLCLDPNGGDQLPQFKQEDFHVSPGADGTSSTRLSITLTFREGTPYEWSEKEYAQLEPVINQWREGRREIAMRIEAGITDAAIQSTITFHKPDGSRIWLDDVKHLLAVLRSLCPVIVLKLHDTESGDGNLTEHSSKTATTNGAVNNLKESDKYILSLYKKAISQPDRLTKDELAAALEALAGLGGRNPASEAARITKYQSLINEIRETSTRSPKNSSSKTRLSRFGELHQLIAVLAIVGTLLETRGTLEFPRSTEPIIAFENLETNLHPIALACIWDLLAQIPVQKLMISNSDDLLASVPLRSLRRIVRRADGLEVRAVGSNTLTKDDMRRLGYHIRLNRADAIMNRCWLLIEGESEGWLLPEMAHVLGFDFKSEGVRCIEFAQCGIEPMIKLAQDLGIEWHLLADGDHAGQSYVHVAKRFLKGEPFGTRISCMKELDIEHHLAKHGFLHVYAEAAGQNIRRNDSLNAVVKSAVKRNSKPALILKVIEAAQESGMNTVSPLLNHVVETSIYLARKVEPDFAVMSPKGYGA